MASSRFLAGTPLRRCRSTTAAQDKMEPFSGVKWQPRRRAVAEVVGRRQQQQQGFSFSAAGMLAPYHIGAAHLLIQKGYITEKTPLAGSSAGAIVCAIIASGMGMEEALKVTKTLNQDCTQNGTLFRLGAVIQDTLNRILPDNIHMRCNGRVGVTVTQFHGWRVRRQVIDEFESKEDLIGAVLASSFIPGYIAPMAATLFRNRFCVDGAFTSFIPPTCAVKTIGVCAVPSMGLLPGIGISPDCNPRNRATILQYLRWAFWPAGDDVLERLFECGYVDARAWAHHNPLDHIHHCTKS